MDGTKSSTLLTLVGADTVDTRLFNGEKLKFSVSFHCRDEAGNEAVRLTRQITVVDPCKAPSTLCAGSHVCSVAGVCPMCNGTECLEWPAIPLEEKVVGPSSLVPEALFRDEEPPILRLLGTGVVATTSGTGLPVMIHHLVVGEAWEDPGVVAIDAVDGDLRAAVEADGAVNTKHPTPALEPYSLRYTVQDNAGNLAVALRRVYVDCTPGSAICPADEFWPGSLPTCGAGGVCGLNPALLLGGKELETLNQKEGVLRMAMYPPGEAASRAPPVIELIGPEVVQVPQGAPYRACEADTPARVVCDRGAVAHDPVQGINLTPMILVCHHEGGPAHLFSSDGLVPCALDTKLPGNHTINFTSTVSVVGYDGSLISVSATVSRVVRVQPSCGQDEITCPDRITCSVDLVCREDLLDTGIIHRWTEEIDEDPGSSGLTLKLLGPEYIDIKQGSTYSPCGPGAVRTPEAPCDSGVLAMESDGSDLTAAVYALPGHVLPSACLDQSCSGLEYAASGLKGCQIDTWAVEGTIFVIQYVLVDTERRSVLTVNRTLTIVAPCEAGHQFCADGTCSPVACELRQRLLGLPAGMSQPTLRLVGSPALTLSYATMDSQEGSLLPCTSASQWGGTFWGQRLPPCGAVAVDSGGTDISAEIEAREISTCQGDGCKATSCPLAALGRGPPYCLPGRYRYQYTVQDKRGLVAVAERDVVIAEVGKVTVKLLLDTSPLVPLQVRLLSMRLLQPDSPQAAYLLAALQISEEDLAMPGLQVGSTSVIGSASSSDSTVLEVGVEVELKSDAATSSAIPLRRRLEQAAGTAGIRAAVAEVSDVLENVIKGGALTAALQASELVELSLLEVKTDESRVSSFMVTPPVDKITGELLSALGELEETLLSLGQILQSQNLLGDLSTGDPYALEGKGKLMSKYTSLIDEAGSAYSSLASNLTLALEASNYVAALFTTRDTVSGIRQETERALADLQKQVAEAAMGMDFFGIVDGIDGQSPCLALYAPLGGTYYVSFSTKAPTAGSNENSVPSIAAPVSSKTLSDDQRPTWGGYLLEIGPARSIPELPLRQSNATLPRWVGATGRNLVLGGLDLSQQRSGLQSNDVCDVRFHHLSLQCQTVEFYELVTNSTSSAKDRELIATYVASLSDPLHPFGSDPVFVVDKSLYNAMLGGLEGEYYDPKTEMNVNGAPYMWFPRGSEGKGFPLLFDTAVDAARAKELWVSADEGNFLDSRTKAVDVHLMIYNQGLDLFAGSTMRMVWTAGGSISALAAFPPALPASAKATLGPILALVLAVLFAAYALTQHAWTWVGAAVAGGLRIRDWMKSRWESTTEVQSLTGLQETCDDDAVSGFPAAGGLQWSKLKSTSSAFSSQGSNPYRKPTFMEVKEGLKVAAARLRIVRAPRRVKAATVMDSVLAVLMLAAVSFHLASVIAVRGVIPSATYGVLDSPQGSLARHATLALSRFFQHCGTPSKSSVEVLAYGVVFEQVLYAAQTRWA